MPGVVVSRPRARGRIRARDAPLGFCLPLAGKARVGGESWSGNFQEPAVCGKGAGVERSRSPAPRVPGLFLMKANGKLGAERVEQAGTYTVKPQARKRCSGEGEAWRSWPLLTIPAPAPLDGSFKNSGSTPCKGGPIRAFARLSVTQCSRERSLSFDTSQPRSRGAPAPSPDLYACQERA
ncbi:hypothetical protein LEMLEM_LOCUS9554 [Lemmus lemmus]